MSDLNLIWNFLMSMFSSIWNLYTGYLVLACSIGLFVLGKLINVIRRVLPHG